jgi:hypothetical protein
LLLNQDCRLIDAGGDYVDEVPYLIGKTTAWEGTPDNNVADIGFHYFNWYYVNADLNQDGIVNFKDFAILANYWQQLTNGPEDLDDSGFVDYNDLSISAGQWLWITGPNIQLQFVGDGNGSTPLTTSNGFVEFWATGFTSDTKRIFLLIDGEYAGPILGFRNEYPLGVDMSEYGSDEKQIKVINVDRDRRVTYSNITNAEFSCPLNYCILTENYEPNKPLYFSAFNPTEGNVSVKVYADCGNLVWSQDYNGVSFFNYIPAEITRQHEIDYVSFDKSGGGSITRFTNWKRPATSGDIKALIIISEPYLRYMTREQTKTVKKAFDDRGIISQKLECESANYENIKKYVHNNPIKYIYLMAHGHYLAFDANGFSALRTHLEMPYEPSGYIVSVKKSDFANPNDAPTWCEELEPDWEKVVNSFYSMDFTDLEFAYFNVCFSGRLRINSNDELIIGQTEQYGLFDIPHSDMSWALNMPSWETKIYQGWYDKAGINPPTMQETEYQKWTSLEWEKLGEGYNLYDVLTYVILQQTEFGPQDPVNNYRIKGQGWIWELFLNND